MNIINKLTLRQMMLNKKRTLVTIIGTIISAAMITAVATLGLSFMDIMQRQSIASNGEWHVKYSNVNSQQMEAIKTNSKVKTAILSSEPGYAYLEGSQNKNKPYLYIKEFSKEGFDNFPIELLSGRLPEKSNELIISEAVNSNAKVDYTIGDTIELTIGQRYSTAKETENIINEPMLQNYSLQWEKDTVAEDLTKDSKQTYTIVGIIKRPTWEFTWSPGYTVISYINENTLSKGETFDVSVIFKQVNNKLFDVADKIALDNGITEYGFNNELLRYYGVIKDDSVKKMLFTLTGIILVIIMIGSVSLIYNAFAISVSERSRYLGMLSSVGATKRQKRTSVFFEGAVIGVISIPIGITAGYIGLGITYICINPMLEGLLEVSDGFRLIIYPSSLITAILVSGLTILISTYIPAKRASNISAIDAIRQVTDVKMSRRQVRTSIITRKIFGIEGDLGLKNLKRNRGRYKATVFSLIISMMLFLVVSSFTDYLKKSIIMTQEGINFDIQTTVNAEIASKKEEIVQKITSLNNISEMTKIDTLDVTTWIKEASIADYLVQEKQVALVDGKYPYYVVINVLDDNTLQKYAKEIGMEDDKLIDPNQLSAVVIDTIRFKDYEADKYVETKVIKTSVGENLNLLLPSSDTNEVQSLKPIKITALTNEMPMGVMPLGKTAGFHIIMSQTSFDKLIEGKEEIVSSGLNTAVYFNSDNPLKLQEDLEGVQNEVGVSSLFIFNVYNYKQNEQQALLLVSVFTYAFIILITAICIANIINTISTSIALRKREFAMLKSIGITPKGFNKMLNYESIFYGVKALIYGLPISILVMYLMYRVLMAEFDYNFSLPMNSIYIVIASVFIIVGTAMLYSSRRVRKENIIDALKQEII
ncbi:MAG: FtsX-like permease family protein [Herbinix sp.]|nr:FtsX-like permease family protein [Herbinix sp.]